MDVVNDLMGVVVGVSHPNGTRISSNIRFLIYIRTVLFFFLMLKIPSLPFPPLEMLEAGEAGGGRVLGRAGLEPPEPNPPPTFLETFLETAIEINNNF